MSSPKIEFCHVNAYRAKLFVPFRIATGQHQIMDNLLYRLRLSNGIEGVGEAAVATHITGESLNQTRKTLQQISKRIMGQEVSQMVLACDGLAQLAQANKAALAAVEMAMMDALTKHMQMPLWRWWGDKKIKFPTDITIVIGDIEESIAWTKRFYRAGFRCFKIKVGRDLDADIVRVKAIAKIARQSQILLDANQGYDAKQTMLMLKEMKKAGIPIALLEQPVPKNDWEGLCRVTASTKVVICADESVGSLSQAVRAVKDRAVRAINIKLMKTGINESVAIMRLAKAKGMRLMFGGMMESPLAMTAAAHVVAGLGGVDFVDLDTPFFIHQGLLNHPCLSSRGLYDLSTVRAGIGIKPRQEWIEHD